MAQASVLKFESYKDYLKVALGELGSGSRARLAKHLRCHSSFVSQVLGGPQNFSLEQAVQIPAFFSMLPLEKDGFVLLVERERSGSRELRKYYSEKLSVLKAEANRIESRMSKQKRLSAENEAIYYSDWQFAAIHVLCSIPEFQSLETIAKRLGMKPEEAQRKVEFLIQAGFLENDDGQISRQRSRIHLPADSPFSLPGQVSWRLRTIDAIRSRVDRDLHYSLVLAVSQKDIEDIGEKILGFVESLEPIIEKSPEEDIVFLGLDYFRL